MSLVEQSQRQHLKTLTPYASARRSMSGGNVWLNANESPFDNGYGFDDAALNRYPQFQSETLNRAYADYAGVQPNQVLSTRGSDEGIELLIRAFCEPGQDSILICPPTYGMYAISAKTYAVDTIEVPLIDSGERKGQLNVEQVITQARSCKVAFLCSPSNPLGNTLNAADIKQVLDACPNTVIVVDEAYIEFCYDDSKASWLTTSPNLVILRTLSKAFALAGIRCGFLLANDDIIELMKKILAPYPLPEPTINIATQALNPDNIERMQQQVDTLIGERERLVELLGDLPLTLEFDSVTNFLLYRCDTTQTNAADIVSTLQQQGVLIRDQSKQLGLDGCIRITVGSREENDELAQRLKGYFS
ncbi:histidinol-phosphate transaminase [Idiomarina piscisalsi]|uniref:histidinol-phosphate transaminase n=1 Tax=Idiomarina piscisalsi TaxID=1096243 RepID=UPI0013859AFE|nr:histidinol-phosphate transaminase [Idiomarina piscisalsi]MTJ02365.1 histidinol-phosphate transaminase [Idiomarina piscisalsi]